MRFLSKVVSFWRNIFRRKQVEQDLNDELQAYVEEMVERKVQAGIPPEAARDAVLLELGGMDRITDLVRQQRIGLGILPRVGVTAVVAIVAFISGASAAVGTMRWSTPEATAPITETLEPPAQRRSPLSFSTLQGRVVDKSTGEPIPFVEVGLEPGVPMRRYTYTDDKGRFWFSNPPTTYQLEAGKQRWALGGLEIIQPFKGQTANESFFLFSPSNVVVTAKDGQALEGERRELHGVALTTKSGGKSVKSEYRRFPYSESIIELRATNLPAGKTTALRKGESRTWLNSWVGQGR